MCGRYSLTTAPEAMRRLFGTKGALPNYPARFNIAPTQAAPVVRTDETGSRELVPLRRGLVPPWSKGLDGRCSMINARAETVATKPAYRGPFRERRCLVPADGFYEWKAEGRVKQPYRFTLSDGGLFAFAGLRDRCRLRPERRSSRAPHPRRRTRGGLPMRDDRAGNGGRRLPQIFESEKAGVGCIAG